MHKKTFNESYNNNNATTFSGPLVFESSVAELEKLRHINATNNVKLQCHNAILKIFITLKKALHYCAKLGFKSVKYIVIR